jgi:NAD(P)-dependent dehydrogenase (short-subunit alcohol dehydrogenase family)
VASMATKNVLITGGARGIGRALTRGFLARGHRVYILDIDEEELRHTVDVHLREHSSRIGSSLCNLRDVKRQHLLTLHLLHD